MKRKLPLGLASMLFGCGVLVGLLLNTSTDAQAPAQTTMTTLLWAQQASVTISYLNQLRAGKTAEAMSLMENHLDADVAKLGAALAAQPAAEGNPQLLKIIQEFRAYRQKYPHESHSSSIDDGIAKAYKALDSGSK
ncbi:MAG TPA: hypothetical protein VG146_10230 [Verrucomicrobiae bacterium]|nr:hypothetical protein [Verrucomicrobiae bacterium]